MIVSEKNVSDALTYLADDPHPVALARKDMTDCENHSDEVYSRLFLASGGASVAAKEAEVRSSGEYQSVKQEEAKAECELERHKARVKAAVMLIEVWRSENANIRAAEQVR
jgi:hypothetical protein